MSTENKQCKLAILRVSIVCVFLLFMFTPCSEALDVRTAKELKEAFEDKKITDVRIISSIEGNFIIPKWVSSLIGAFDKEIVITPEDVKKPVFDANSGLYGASDTLKISNLTIVCDGDKSNMNVGINLNSLTKQVYVEKVIFKGKADSKKNISGIYPSNNASLRDCTFENLTWGVYAISGSNSIYDISITSSSFQNVAQAFAANEERGKVNIVNGKGQKLYSWIFLHKAGSMTVTIDQASINNTSNAGFAHRYLDKQGYDRRGEKTEISKYIDDYDQKKDSLRNDPFIDNTYIQSIKRQNDYDAALVQLKRELQNELREIDFSDSDAFDMQLHIRRSITLYYLLADCLSDFDWEASVKRFISDETLRKAILYQCLWSYDQLAMLELSTPNIFWGNSDNMRTVFTKFDVSLADRIFRDNLYIFRDWLEALAGTEKLMEKLKTDAEGYFEDVEYIRDLKVILRKIYDLQIVASRLVRVAFFDIPMQTAFTISYSKTVESVKDNKGLFGSLSDKGKDRIIQIAREIAPFYTVSQQLCILNSTNDLRMELIREWKTALKKDSDEEMKTYLATDADIMREAERIEKFYHSWR